MLTVILIVLIVLLLAGGIPAYQRRADWGYAPGSVIGLILIIVLVLLILRLV